MRWAGLDWLQLRKNKIKDCEKLLHGRGRNVTVLSLWETFTLNGWAYNFWCTLSDTSASEGSIPNKTDILGTHLDSLDLLSTCGELVRPHGWPWTKPWSRFVYIILFSLALTHTLKAIILKLHENHFSHLILESRQLRTQYIVTLGYTWTWG